ncbi:hypothetical protein FQZ97_962680 [compost metagenome]
MALISTSSASVTRCAASCPEAASSPAITSKVLCTSASLSCTATAPRFGTSSTRPSAARVLMASRSGVRETLSCSHSSRSLSLAPGAICPSTNIWRKRWVACSCKAAGGMEKIWAVIFCIQKLCLVCRILGLIRLTD